MWRTDPCGKCGKSFRWDENDKPDECPRCGSKDWMDYDTTPEGCFDLTIRPL